MNDHTSGPWQVVGDWGGFSIRTGRSSREGAEIVGRCDKGAEKEANATLMAAAPELLVACKLVKHWIEKHATWSGEEPPYHELGGAIVKAENW